VLADLESVAAAPAPRALRAAETAAGSE